MLHLNSIIGKGDLAEDFLTYSLIIMKACLIAAVIMITIGMYYSYRDRKSAITKSQSTRSSTIHLVFSTIILVISIVIGVYSINMTKSKEPIKPRSLTDIAHLISVKDSQVKIEPLTNMHSNYLYDVHENQSSGFDTLETDKTQIFKIEEDTFYDRMYLIDKNNHKSELSEDEKNMIKSKRNQ